MPSSLRHSGAHAHPHQSGKRATITGVEDVDCFNEQIVVLRTPLGTLTLTGAGLNISHLNLEEGRVEIDGELDAMEYTGRQKIRRIDRPPVPLSHAVFNHWTDLCVHMDGGCRDLDWRLGMPC